MTTIRQTSYLEYWIAARTETDVKIFAPSLTLAARNFLRDSGHDLCMAPTYAIENQLAKLQPHETINLGSRKITCGALKEAWEDRPLITEEV